MVGCTPPCAVLLISTDPDDFDFVETVKPLAPHLQLEVCRELAQALLLLRQEEFALVVVHVHKGACHTEVKELLWALSDIEPPVASLLIFDECDHSARSEFLRAGAADCLPRTGNPQRLTHALETLTYRAQASRIHGDNAEKAPSYRTNPDSSFYVHSPQLEQMMEQVRRVAPQDTTILFTGETGTGKTRIARLIHSMSPHGEDPCLIVDCNALSPTLIESELFGHVKGAFTGADKDREGKFAAAGKGTLVLDEINSLPLHLQSKLLRAVDERVFEPVGSNETRPLKARLITISNASLEQEVQEGRFRRDLFYRLNCVTFCMPPLRESCGAISPLAQKFLIQFAEKYRRVMAGIKPEALRALERFHWPGNIRELRSVIESAVSCFAGPFVELDHLPEKMRTDTEVPGDFNGVGDVNAKECGSNYTSTMMSGGSDGLTLTKTKERAEVVRITAALRKNGNNKLRTARELGISRMALYKKLYKYNLYNTA